MVFFSPRPDAKCRKEDYCVLQVSSIFVDIGTGRDGMALRTKCILTAASSCGMKW